MAGANCSASFVFQPGSFRGIKSQIRFASASIEAVTFKAVGSQYGANIAVELDGVCGICGAGGNG